MDSWAAKLLASDFLSIQILVNDHKVGYLSVEHYLEQCFADGFSLASPEIMKGIIERNIIICVQCYPETAVGCVEVYHYDLELACKAVFESLQEEGE